MSSENYIGSKISLISRSDIRYVGKLHSINAQDSTVGLEQVRSFGTEGRRGNPEDEIPLSHTVYDFVVFRGTDIKDLQVFEAPPKSAPLTQPQQIQDPAIMSTGYPPQYMPQPTHWQPQQQPQQQPQHQQQPQQPSLPQLHAQPLHSQMSSQQQPLQLQQPFVSVVPQQAEQSPNLQPQQKPQQKSQQKSQTEPQPQQFEKQQRTGVTQPRLSQQQESLPTRQNVSPPVAYKGINEAAIESLAKKVSEMNIPTESGEPRPRRQSNHGRGPRKTELNIPKTDFDFESSNSKFEKTKMTSGDDEDETGAELLSTPEYNDTCYDSKSSFFDNISCESKERNEQRNKGENPRKGYFQEERKMNMETFGQATTEGQRLYGRGRGRGHGGYYRNNNGNRQRDQGSRYQQHQSSKSAAVPLV